MSVLSLDYLRSIEDPVVRYSSARAAEPGYKRELAKIARSAVAELLQRGMSTKAVAETLGVTRQRVEQMRDEMPERPEPLPTPLPESEVQRLRAAVGLPT